MEFIPCSTISIGQLKNYIKLGPSKSGLSINFVLKFCFRNNNYNVKIAKGLRFQISVLQKVTINPEARSKHCESALQQQASPGVTKGQLILKCPFGVFKSPKISTKFFPGFLPQPLKRGQIKKGHFTVDIFTIQTVTKNITDQARPL